MIAEVNALTVCYGKKVAVSDATCSIPVGCTGLLGPNGAGKSTLIKSLMGFIRPVAGSGTVLGRNISTDGLDIRMHVGLMPELDCHIPGMSAVEYVAYAGELSGMPSAMAMSRAHEVLEYCGLGEARYRHLETYSTGMKQKAKLAQALVHGPQLLFLDEPTNGLDPQGRDEMLNLIRDISHGKSVNVVVSSHLLPDIERTCDHLIVMQSGKIKTQGRIDEIKQFQQVQWDIEIKEPVSGFDVALQSKGARVVSHSLIRYRIEFMNGDHPLTQAVFMAAKESGAQIRELRPATKTLEEAFLEVLE